MFVNPFLPVQMGSRSDLLSKKNGYKSHDTVPLTVRAGYKKTLNRSVKEIKPKLNVFVYTAFELVFGIFKHFNKKQ